MWPLSRLSSTFIEETLIIGLLSESRWSGDHCCFLPPALKCGIVKYVVGDMSHKVGYFEPLAGVLLKANDNCATHNE